MAWDDVPPDEAYDLMRTLPDGALSVARVHPERAWCERHRDLRDLTDALWAVAMWNGGGVNRSEATAAMRTGRPEDAARQRAAATKARSVRDVIEHTEWEEVTDGGD